MNYERLFETLFYIFGSWAMIHGGYIMGKASIRRRTFESRKEKWEYAVQQFFPSFGAMAFVLGAGTLGFAHDDKFYTLEGIIQAVLVIGIPVGVGIASGLSSSIVSAPPSLQSSDASQELDSLP